MAERIPGVASTIDLGKNLFKLWNFGYSGKISKPAGLGILNHNWSVGGIAGIPMMAAAGAGIGAVAGSMVDNSNGAIAGATIGGAAVLTAPVLLGMGAKSTLNIGTALGDGMLNVGKSLVNNFSKEAVGAKALSTGASIGGFGFKALGAVSASPLLNGVFNPMNMVKRTADVTKGIGGVQLSALGKTVVGIGTLADTIHSTWNAEKKVRMGQIDPNITRATPNIPSYMDNAGATGDLVFAMNRNRRG